MCLVLPGRQHFGKPVERDAMEGHDSVVGREGQRGVDEWVFFRSDQLLVCFLLDELGLIMAKEAAKRAIHVLHQPWEPMPRPWRRARGEQVAQPATRRWSKHAQHAP